MNLNLKSPKALPPMFFNCQVIFHMMSIRYIENIPNKCKDDLKTSRCKAYKT